MHRGNYCVIGAGAAGLGALQVLLHEGFSVDCFERADRVGGHWHTDYDCLHLITPRDSSGFDGFPMPSEYPLFPSRDQMRDYILGFAAHHGGSAHRVQHGRGGGAAARREWPRRLGGHDLRRRAPRL
jgi:cation diffusion facilitator CzcD-associated flavoprotein CzcO